MAKTFRFNDTEEKALHELSVRLNKELVKMGKMPLRDTEICHEIINQTIINGIVEITRSGEIRVITG